MTMAMVGGAQHVPLITGLLVVYIARVIRVVIRAAIVVVVRRVRCRVLVLLEMPGQAFGDIVESIRSRMRRRFMAMGNAVRHGKAGRHKAGQERQHDHGPPGPDGSHHIRSLPPRRQFRTSLMPEGILHLDQQLIRRKAPTGVQAPGGIAHN